MKNKLYFQALPLKLYSQSYDVAYMEFNLIIYLVLKIFYFILHKSFCYSTTKQN